MAADTWAAAVSEFEEHMEGWHVDAWVGNGHFDAQDPTGGVKGQLMVDRRGKSFFARGATPAAAARLAGFAGAFIRIARAKLGRPPSGLYPKVDTELEVVVDDDSDFTIPALPGILESLADPEVYAIGGSRRPKSETAADEQGLMTIRATYMGTRKVNTDTFELIDFYDLTADKPIDVKDWRRALLSKQPPLQAGQTYYVGGLRVSTWQKGRYPPNVFETKSYTFYVPVPTVQPGMEAHLPNVRSFEGFVKLFDLSSPVFRFGHGQCPGGTARIGPATRKCLTCQHVGPDSDFGVSVCGTQLQVAEYEGQYKSFRATPSHMVEFFGGDYLAAHELWTRDATAFREAYLNQAHKCTVLTLYETVVGIRRLAGSAANPPAPPQGPDFLGVVLGGGPALPARTGPPPASPAAPLDTAAAMAMLQNAAAALGLQLPLQGLNLPLLPAAPAAGPAVPAGSALPPDPVVPTGAAPQLPDPAAPAVPDAHGTGPAVPAPAEGGAALVGPDPVQGIGSVPAVEGAAAPAAAVGAGAAPLPSGPEAHPDIGALGTALVSDGSDDEDLSMVEIKQEPAGGADTGGAPRKARSRAPATPPAPVRADEETGPSAPIKKRRGNN